MKRIQAVILAAGAGRRLGRGPKALVPFLGLRLVERSVLALREAGADEFIVVVGAGGEATARAVASSPRLRDVPLRVVVSEAWEQGNGASAIAAMAFVRTPFLLAMADHVIEPAAVRRLLREPPPAMLVDFAPAEVILREATKVRVDAGRVVAAGKSLQERAVDAGFFLCDESVVLALREHLAMGQAEWNAIYPDVRPRAVDVSGTFWADLDTPQDFERAERVLLRNLAKAEDGPVSRYLNRRISGRISKALVDTSITPNKVSLVVFVISVLGAALFWTGDRFAFAAGGVLVQIGSILDGTDGEIARLRFQTSPLGAWVDATLDRYADAIVIVGITMALPVLDGSALVVAFAALSGSLLVSYTAARYEGTFHQPAPFQKGVVIPAKRDTRSLIVMLGGLTGALFPALMAIAALTNAEVVRRVLVVRRNAVYIRRNESS